jgi:hypothetical protein
MPVFRAKGQEPPPPTPPSPIWEELARRAEPINPIVQTSFAVDNVVIASAGPVVAAAAPPTVLPPTSDAPVESGLSPWVAAAPCDGISMPADLGSGSFGRWYGSGEYLLWWIKDTRLPPLVTTSSPASSGILGMPDTVVLFGGNMQDNEERSGGRFTVGYWFDACQETAIEGSFFFLGDRTFGFGASSTDFPVLARPFFALNFGTEFSEVTASPGLATGRIDVAGPSRFFGSELNVRRKWCCGCDYRLDLFAGFRYLDLDESLAITESVQALPGVPMFGGDRIFIDDIFNTHNRFYGGQIGADAEWRRGPWTLNVRGKLALGDTQEVITIGGSQRIITPDGQVSNFRGGLLALSSNIGHFHRNEFGVVPELGLNIGYQVTERLRAFIGYNFLYWNNVVRPGDQIDRVVDVTKIPNFPVTGVPAPGNRPAVLFRETEFWAQGISLGLEFRY